MNYKIQLLHQQLSDALNESGVPVAAAYYVVKDIYTQLQILMKETVEEETNLEPKQEEIIIESADPQEQVEEVKL